MCMYANVVLVHIIMWVRLMHGSTSYLLSFVAPSHEPHVHSLHI